MSRAISPVFGTTLLVSLTVLLATTVALTSFGTVPGIAAVEPVVLEGHAAPTGRVTLSHVAGPPLELDGIRLRVTVDGDPLDHQPPTRFFASKGFRSGPTGPFNTATDSRWTVGERASFTVAGTNTPTLAPGSTVEIGFFRDGRRVVRVTMTVG